MFPFHAHRPTFLSGNQQGFGMLQVMLVLLLVASLLATTLLVNLARRAPEQAIDQEQSLRWADEALAAFALSQSRLPCPARQPNGHEDCSAEHSKGWLPLQTLLGASGSHLQPMPMAYLVYRGHEESQPDEFALDPSLTLIGAGDGIVSTDLAAPTPGNVEDEARDARHNAYRPRGLDGSQRIIEEEVDTGTRLRSFAAINTLDLCRKLELATIDGYRSDLAQVDVSGNGAAMNVAYALAAAGPQSTFDNTNTDGSNRLESPWREWDSGYDDRVWLRSFQGLAGVLGCHVHQVPATTAGTTTSSSVNTISGNLANIGVDLLASALTLHDTLANLQDNNVGNTEVALIDAQFAQAASVTSIILSIGQIADATSSLIANSASLARAVFTCAITMGLTCWEVPLKTAAVTFSTVSLVSNAIAGGLNVGALIPTAMALDATLAARDRAQKAARQPAEDLDSAIAQLACSLYGSNAVAKGKTSENPCSDQAIEEYERDEDGYPIPLLDDQNRQLFDEKGNPLYKTKPGSRVQQEGLDDRLAAAASELASITGVYTLMKTHRIDPFDDDNILARVDSQRSLGLHNNRYWPTERYCRRVTDGSGTHWYGGDLLAQCRIATPVDDQNVGDAVIDTRRVFDASLARSDAIGKRNLAQAWVLARQRQDEHQGELDQAINIQSRWITGNDPMINKLKRDRDAECSKDQGNALNKSRCESAIASHAYMDTCIRDGVEDRNPDAMCRHRIADRVNALKAEANSLAQQVARAKRDYDAAPSPFIVFPAQWRFQSLKIVTDAAGNPSAYQWLDAHSQSDMNFVDLFNQKPYTGAYYQKYDDSTNGPLLDTREGPNKETKKWCEILWQANVDKDYRINTGRYCATLPYNQAYSDYLRIKLTFDKKKEIHDQLALQFEQMENDYQRLKCQRAQEEDDNKELKDLDKHYCSSISDNGIRSSPIGIGGESLLERADNRGAVGPRRQELR